MHYDVASKVILSRCKKPFLKFFCKLSIEDAELLEVRPQEIPSLRRSDFVIKTTLENGTEFLVLLEFVSSWKHYIPLRTLECRCRHILFETLPVKTFIILLKSVGKAKEFYQDEEVEYRYNLVRIYEFDAEEVLKRDIKCLYAFLPLMRGGEKHVDEAERRIYESEISREEKADLLTGMAILGGLISEEIPRKLIERRRDIMIESAAYEIIKREGYEEGIKQGIKQGIQQGIQQGLLEEAREMVIEALEEKFGLLSPKLIAQIKAISQREILKSLLRLAIKVKSLEEFKEALKKIEED